jgi:hypothetical protein
MSASAFRSLLEYLYTGELSAETFEQLLKVPQECQAFLDASRSLQIRSIEEAVMNEIPKRVDRENWFLLVPIVDRDGQSVVLSYLERCLLEILGDRGKPPSRPLVPTISEY